MVIFTCPNHTKLLMTLSMQCHGDKKGERSADSINVPACMRACVCLFVCARACLCVCVYIHARLCVRVNCNESLQACQNRCGPVLFACVRSERAGAQHVLKTGWSCW